MERLVAYMFFILSIFIGVLAQNMVFCHFKVGMYNTGLQKSIFWKLFMFFQQDFFAPLNLKIPSIFLNQVFILILFREIWFSD